MSGKSDFYTHAGVNTVLGDSFSSAVYKICKDTWDNSPYVRVHNKSTHFRGSRSYECLGVPTRCRYAQGSDGIGTKVNFITEAFAHDTAGYDLLAMASMDQIRFGNLPLVYTNVLDVASLGKDEADQTYRLFLELFNGLRNAAHDASVVLFSGETAELGMCVGSWNPDATTKFNWSGSITALMDPKREISGERIQRGDVVIALRERGFRSNGMSAVRLALETRFGVRWWEHPDAQRIIGMAALPSVSYDRFLATMNGWYVQEFRQVVPVSGIAHITGGGIPAKFAADILFPLGLSAELDDLYDPPEVMRQCAEWNRTMSDIDIYHTWNCGQGALVVMPPWMESRFLREAAVHGVEAKSCGRITKRSEPEMHIVSKFSGHRITFR